MPRNFAASARDLTHGILPSLPILFTRLILLFVKSGHSSKPTFHLYVVFQRMYLYLRAPLNWRVSYVTVAERNCCSTLMHSLTHSLTHSPVRSNLIN